MKPSMLFSTLLILLLFTSCKKENFKNDEDLTTIDFIQYQLKESETLMTLFQNMTLLKSSFFEGNKIKSEFIKDGVSINDDAVRNALNPNINRDFKLAVKLLKEVPQIKQLTSNQLNKVLIELYHDYLQEEQNDLILIMGKCEELRDLQRGECDFNYYVSYGVCLLTGAASGPFAPAVTVACVGGATAIFINCYNVADRSYQICSR